jgi:hypothetical protein
MVYLYPLMVVWVVLQVFWPTNPSASWWSSCGQWRLYLRLFCRLNQSLMLSGLRAIPSRHQTLLLADGALVQWNIPSIPRCEGHRTGGKQFGNRLERNMSAYLLHSTQDTQDTHHWTLLYTGLRFNLVPLGSSILNGYFGFHVASLWVMIPRTLVGVT